MRLTKGTDYGLLGLVYLAQKPQGKVVLVGEIAKAQGLSESYLAKLFQDLARSGVLTSHRGARGGFSLTRPARDISLLEIVEAIEGPITLQPCLDLQTGCERIGMCGICIVLGEAQAKIVQVLRSSSLQDILDQVPAEKQQEVSA